MQIEAQQFLRLVENAKTLVFLDIEATGLRGDYNSVLVTSIRPYGSRAESFIVDQPGRDRAVVKATKERLEEADAWVTYYGKGFDIGMLNTRLLRWKLPPIEKRPHVDLYFTLKSNILTAHRSQGHLLSWLKTPQEKMSVSAEVWNALLANPKKELKTMVARCNSDTDGLQALYNRTKHLIRDITR
jgi:RNase_H superfamily